MTTPREQAKAIVAGLAAGLTALGTALTDGGVAASEWTAVAVAALVAYGAVYRTGQPASLSTLPHLPSGELLDLAEKAADREKREQR